MLIHEAAAATGLTIDTIRYYERQRLIDDRHVSRQPNGYRHYTPAAIARLQHFKHARAQGYTIAEIRALAHAYDSGQLGANERRAFLNAKIGRISRQIAALESMRRTLEQELAVLREGQA